MASRIHDLVERRSESLAQLAEANRATKTLEDRFAVAELLLQEAKRRHQHARRQAKQAQASCLLAYHAMLGRLSPSTKDKATWHGEVERLAQRSTDSLATDLEDAEDEVLGHMLAGNNGADPLVALFGDWRNRKRRVLEAFG